MEIDEETEPKVCVFIDDVPAFLNELRMQAEEKGLNEVEDDNNVLYSGNEFQKFHVTYYYNEEDNTININLDLRGNKGGITVDIVIPLSDIVLSDILQSALNRFNKLNKALKMLKGDEKWK